MAGRDPAAGGHPTAGRGARRMAGRDPAAGGRPTVPAAGMGARVPHRGREGVPFLRKSETQGWSEWWLEDRRDERREAA